MKTILKILATPVVIGLTFAVGTGFLWCIGKLLLLIKINIFPHFDDAYTFAEIVMIGGLHLLVLFAAVMILIMGYNVTEAIHDLLNK